LPIDKTEFSGGKAGKAYYSLILEFLENNRDRAYTAQEIEK